MPQSNTLVENCGNTFILRCSASEQGGTSQFASRLIGQREVVNITQSKTRRPGDWLASTTTSEQRHIEPAVMASEIERLPDLEGFLKFASIPDWMHLALSYVSYPSVDRGRSKEIAALIDEPTQAAASVASSMVEGAAAEKKPRRPANSNLQ